ncbi:hypothetical protein K2173_016400 [Erythroxylum novogranatense]|uniref:Uncharacterized protein n=1 Tax=Erythroxylum novogranatense TaxID=1862640 RepID=A0AAV8SGT1_9ROSI|nr:hypothetical protein K2173_016400 [Erythroxylum novogranatense]
MKQKTRDNTPEEEIKEIERERTRFFLVGTATEDRALSARERERGKSPERKEIKLPSPITKFGIQLLIRWSDRVS